MESRIVEEKALQDLCVTPYLKTERAVRMSPRLPLSPRDIEVSGCLHSCMSILFENQRRIIQKVHLAVL